MTDALDTGIAADDIAADDIAADDIAADDIAVVAAQLGRTPRGLHAVAHRCSCGLPDVVQTCPRLGDGTPFPTLYYLTCPRARSAVGRLESAGVMREMTSRLGADADLAARHRSAHEDYLRRRDAVEVLPGAVSAGGMPDRVKCLHVLVAHELAAPGTNVLGREALTALGDWGAGGPCVPTRVSPDLRDRSAPPAPVAPPA